MKKKVLRNFVWFPILAYIVLLAGSIPAGIVDISSDSLNLSALSKFVFVDLALGFAGISLLVFAIVKFREKRTLADIGLTKKNALKDYFKGFVVGMLMMGLATGVIYLLGGMKLELTAANVGLAMIPSVLFTLIGWTIQGSTEEILTRGWMLPQLSERYNFYVGILVTSVFFMAFHLGNNSISLMPVLNLTLFAVFAALYAAKAKNIWGICGFHVSWNWMQGNLLGIEVSGSSVPGGSLIKLQGVGNELISGGGFGVEGSIISSIVFAVAIVYLIIQLRKERSDLSKVGVY